jgi:glycosyltransferase involved in cell wall biosynthesis
MLLFRQLVTRLARLAEPPLAIASVPIVADLMGTLSVKRWVYYCVDDFGEWPALDGPTMRSMERIAIERADVLIAVSDPLREKLRAHRRNVHLLTHGVDLAHWTGQARFDRTPELEGLERPLIVFWGVIDRRLDRAFLDRVDRTLETGTLVLMGPRVNPDPAVLKLHRVVHVPTVPYQRLPAVAEHAAVLVMPYADLPVTRAMQPLKLKEYMATGRPVIARDLPSTRLWGDCIDLASSPDEFSAAVVTRLMTGVTSGQTRGRQRLRQEDWDDKARRFERMILGSVASNCD